MTVLNSITFELSILIDLDSQHLKYRVLCISSPNSLGSCGARALIWLINFDNPIFYRINDVRSMLSISDCSWSFLVSEL